MYDKSLIEAIWAANEVAVGTFMHWPGKWISGEIEKINC